MKFLRLMLVVYAIGFPAGSNAATTAVASTVTTIEEPACGKWVKERTDDKNSWAALINENWLLGYLSGLASANNSSFLRDTNSDRIDFWMDSYCKSNPLDNISEGAKKLTKELIKKSH